jgi:diadenosine tetraphosphate (Ap4A) HIT family hydrolase
MINNCPFCEIATIDSAQRIVLQNELALVIRDGYPITGGHSLIIPKRHVASFFEVTNDEKSALFNLLEDAKKALDQEFKPSAYNIGINDGTAAGQTVPHLHIHLIPRYDGDVEDPRGGIRWIMPDKARYW